jgi:hypothetical protein
LLTGPVRNIVWAHATRPTLNLHLCNRRLGVAPADSAPEIYQLAMLVFADGSRRRGSWNGRFWWGYDERVRRSCPLEPVAWRPIL